MPAQVQTEAMNGPTPKSLNALELETWLSQTSELTVVDVREEQELLIAPFPFPVKHLPLSDAQNWMGTLDEVLPQTGSIVVLCHAGVRSWNFACWLLEQQPARDVWNLEGGIDSWSVTVDPKVPRY
jgi:rhodanese-related sulfurtransferase